MYIDNKIWKNFCKTWKTSSNLEKLLQNCRMSTMLLLIVLTLVCFHHPLSEADILPDDTPLLKALRDSLINRTEAISNWFVPNSPPCNWTGIKCQGLLVNHIDLSSSPLNLPFPRLIAEFKSLNYLNLSHCGFTGEIFPDLWDLKNLNVIDLSNNRLSGTMFPKIGYKLKYLRRLILDNNNLSGSLPSTIGHLTNLLELSIHSNSFTGNLPKEVGSLRHMQSLDISGNSFSGNLPASLGNLTSLFFFSARQNVLTGPVPPEIGKLKKLKILDLSWNSFSGSVPEGVSNSSNLTYLNFSQNDFDGELLPSTIGQLLNLVYLVAANSGLKGQIPPGIGKCTKLRTLDLSFNLLDGPLPASMAGLVSIHSILLNTNRLSGPIPLWILNWKQVKSITISQNMFSGPLPPLHLPLLSILDASANLLSGELSPDICYGAKSLTTLSLSRNNFSGSIGNGTFKDCQNLAELILSENNISGEIPGYLGNLRLINLELSTNKLSGKVPYQLWESETLMGVSLDNNLLEGPLSDHAFVNIPTLVRLQMDNNLFGGKIPSSIGQLKNLTNLSLHGNNLTGDIPSELFDCTELVSVDLGRNRLTGQIPKSISKLKLLDNLVLSGNKLSGQIPEEICSGFQMVPLPDSEFVQHYGLLDLSENELVGLIPRTIKHCIVLKELLLHGNKLNGNIPEELASLANLTLLDLSFNSFSGTVFPKLFSMTSLQGLVLAHNKLDGSIPDNISPALSSLAKLDLSSNYLSGSLTLTIFNAKCLTYLNASNNRLSGPLDDDFVSNFESLSVLDLHNNKLDGRVPGSISNLPELTYLDLSENNFRDYFPCNICTIQGLIFANFSGNSFVGPFLNSCADKNPCIIPNLSHASKLGINVAIVVAIFVFLILLLVGLLLKWKRQKQDAVLTIDKNKKAVMMSSEPTSSEGLLGKRKKIKEPLSINIATFEHSLLKIKASDIFFATENFSESYIIGDGGFGTVYRALLPGGRTIAVKRLNGGHLHGEREFLAEMETIGKVKHENLIPLLGYCVSADERFLIYEYMENGSLDFWLRNQADAVGSALDWPARFKICLGSARGLAFLHHGFVPRVIHRDIKSSNILLDRNFEARVSDFGLARIISACETHVSTMLAGTFGYIPPEYGLKMLATAKGDVYSFGVVMLELVTGQAPIGQTDVEGGNLVGWVRWMVENRRECEILDPCFSGSGVWKDQMMRVLCIARSCTEDEPCMRPSMLEVLKMLKQVRIA